MRFVYNGAHLSLHIIPPTHDILLQSPFTRDDSLAPVRQHRSRGLTDSQESAGLRDENYVVGFDCEAGKRAFGAQRVIGGKQQHANEMLTACLNAPCISSRHPRDRRRSASVWCVECGTMSSVRTDDESSRGH